MRSRPTRSPEDTPGSRSDVDLQNETGQHETTTPSFGLQETPPPLRGLKPQQQEARNEAQSD